MQITIDQEQAKILDDVLRRTLVQLRVASARADSHDFRDELHRQEHLIEEILAKLPEGSAA